MKSIQTSISASCPFTAIAQTKPSHARTLAAAIAHSVDLDQVVACLRFDRRLNGSDLFGYLDGSHFAAWQGEDGCMDEFGRGSDLREFAWSYLDALEGK
jgi:hypothetical protein